MLIKENDCVRRPLNRADVETHLIVCARIEGPKNDRPHVLRNGLVRFPELQLSSFSVEKPRPPVVDLVEVHARHLSEYSMHHGHVMHMIIQPDRLKNLTGPGHYDCRLSGHVITSGCAIEMVLFAPVKKKSQSSEFVSSMPRPSTGEPLML